MKNYLKEGYETYKRIEYNRVEKRRNESRNQKDYMSIDGKQVY